MWVVENHHHHHHVYYGPIIDTNYAHIKLDHVSAGANRVTPVDHLNVAITPLAPYYNALRARSSVCKV